MAITNTATATSATPDPNLANNSASPSTTVVNRGDLAVTKAGPATADVNTDVIYHLVVFISGRRGATSLQCDWSVEVGTSVVDQNYDPGDPLPSSCNLGAINDCSTEIVGVSCTDGVTLTVLANSSDNDGMVITNTATATSDTPDPNLVNNSCSASTTVVNAADLVVTKTGPATADVNTDVVYHLVVTNNGPLAAQNVHLLDVVPAGMTFVDQNYDTGDPVPSVCNFGATIDCST